MNAKEAREIYHGFPWREKRCGSCEPNYCQHPEARGYLAALDGPEVKILEDALENCSRWYRFKGDEEGRALDGLRLAQGVAEKARAQFQASKEGKAQAEAEAE